VRQGAGGWDEISETNAASTVLSARGNGRNLLNVMGELLCDQSVTGEVSDDISGHHQRVGFHYSEAAVGAGRSTCAAGMELIATRFCAVVKAMLR